MNNKTEFPDLKPVKGAPDLTTINSIGFKMYGKRDFDPNTNTYVKTHFFVVLFIPILAIGAYRVADAPNGGWYFFGKTRLSKVARMWNYLLASSICLFFLGIYLLGQFPPENYKLLAEGKKLEKEGRYYFAVEKYADLSVKSKPESWVNEAKKRLHDITVNNIHSCNASDQVRILKKALRNLPKSELQKFIPDLGQDLMRRHVDKGDYGTALRIFNLAAKFYDDDFKKAKKLELLKDYVTLKDADINYVEELANHYYEKDDKEKFREVLEPHIDRLGASETALKLGKIYSEEGDLVKADKLLSAYVEKRLEKLRKAEEEYDNLNKTAEKRYIKELRNGEASQGWYSRYESCGEKRRQEMVNEYVMKRYKSDSRIKNALRKIEEESKVIPFVMELAITKLHLSREQKTEEDRIAMLKKAESLFLSIKNIAGESESFNIFLGQVKYWLGDYEEGSKLFDLALEQSKRDPAILLVVSRTLREIGDDNKASELAKEAYEKGNQDQKYSAASLVGAISDDLDEKIEWLKKGDPENDGGKASLAYFEGIKAGTEGRYNEELKIMHKADNIYKKIPVSALALNNHSLVINELYAITGNVKYLDKFKDMMERSERLQPTNTITKSNLVQVYNDMIPAKMIKDKIDYSILKRSPEYMDMQLLVQSNVEFDELLKKCDKECLTKLCKIGNELNMLAPESFSGRCALLNAAGYQKDIDLCKTVLKSLGQTSINTVGFHKTTAEEKVEKIAALKRKENHLNSILIKNQDLQGITRALLLCNITLCYKNLYSYNGDLEFEKALAYSKEAYRIHPSLFTKEALVYTYLNMAMYELTKEDPVLKEKWLTFNGDLELVNFICLMSYKSPGFKDKIAKNKYFREALMMYKDSVLLEKDQLYPQAYVMLNNTYPEVAGRMAKDWEFDKLFYKAYINMDPGNLDNLAVLCWIQAAGGDNKGVNLLTNALNAYGMKF